MRSNHTCAHACRSRLARVLSASANPPLSFVAREPDAASAGVFSLERIRTAAAVRDRLAARQEVSAEDFAGAMELRAAAYGQSNYSPQGPVEAVGSGAYYLVAVDQLHRRTYERKP